MGEYVGITQKGIKKEIFTSLLIKKEYTKLILVILDKITFDLEA